MLTSDFAYDLPSEAIAQVAIEPRDSARMLEVSGLRDWRVRDLTEVLAPGDLLVVNNTRVRSARLYGRKVPTGGRVELLLLRPVGHRDWIALCRPSRKLTAGTRLDVGRLTAHLITAPDHGVVTVRFDEPVAVVEDMLPSLGDVPMPPYFHGGLPDGDRYQTMFAKRVGSAAAPTAGLHFTPELVSALRARDIQFAEVDLEVGLDTFRPIAAARIADHVMHSERYHVPGDTARAVASARGRGGRIVAVGTTVVRTLESASDDDGVLVADLGETALFITPGYRFRVVDAVLTNFHAPGTSLMVMVGAMLGDAWREAYHTALGRGYRFLSFGDAMFIGSVKPS